MPPELTVILPVYNEELEVCATIATLQTHLNSLGIVHEILVVDDGSRDATYARARSMEGPCVKVFTYHPNRGKGYAIHWGMTQACGQWCLFMDVDLSTDLAAIGEFLSWMRSGAYDILIGDRKSDPRLQVRRQPRVRRLLGRVFTFLSCLVVGKYIRDFTCGFKMFNAKAIEIILPRQRVFDWSFDTELIGIALAHRLRIGEVPVFWKHEGGSKVRLVKDVFVSLWGLLKIKANIVLNRYR